MPSAPIDLRPTKQGPKRHGTSRYDALTEERARLRAQREAMLAAQEAEAAEEAAFADDGTTGKRKKSGKNATGNQDVVEPRERVVDDDAYAPASGPATVKATHWEELKRHRAGLSLDEIAADNRAAPPPDAEEPPTDDLSAIEQRAQNAKVGAGYESSWDRDKKRIDRDHAQYYGRPSNPATKR